jgi:UMF1 family MFS transporter
MSDAVTGSTETSSPRLASRRGVFGWMMFDFAAQPFFTVITTFIFGPYFVNRLAENPEMGQAVWGYTLAAAGIFVGLLSPVLGSIADVTGPRKPWIAGFAIVKILSLIALWWMVPGTSLFWPAMFMVLATISAEFSIVFNDSMMNRLVRPANIGRVSNIAWGLGYLGGMIVLIVVVGLLAGSPDTGKTALGLDPLFGLDPATGDDARVTGPIGALWYLVFILPMFFFTPDMNPGPKVQGAVKQGLVELKSTWGELRQRAGLLRFFIGRMFYQDGVNALVTFGGTFAVGMFGWVTLEIGIFGILLNMVAIPSCIIAGFIDSRVGSRLMIIGSIFCLIFATIGIVGTTPDSTLFGFVQLDATDPGGLFATEAEKAYLFFGAFIGLAFGPIQASSRSYLGQSVSPEDSGRFFGLYSLIGRATSFVAPFTVATVTLWTGSAAAGMSTLLVFFLVGLAFMVTVPKPSRPAGDTAPFRKAAPITS